MRIASHSIAQSLARAVATNQAEHAAEQLRIASGRKYQTRSEDAVATAQAADLKQNRALAGQFYDNIQQASAWTAVTESNLDGILGSVARAQEIAVEANDATLSDGARQALSAEIDAILEDLLAQANSRFGGVPLFGGAGGQPPVAETRDADGRITAVAYAAGSDAARTVPVGENATVACGVAATGASGVFADPAAGRDLFQSLIDLRDQIGGGTIADTTVASLATAFDGTTQALVQTGLQTSRLGTLELQGQTMDVALAESLSDLTETDMAAAISRLSELQASLEASLQLAARVGQFSLVNYI